MGTGDHNAGEGGGGGGGNLVMDSHPIQGGVAIFLVASCYRKRS